MIHQVLELLEARWLIHRDTALACLPMFVAFLNGQKVLWEKEEDALHRKARALSFTAGEPVAMAQRHELSDPNLPDNSLAVIPIWGTMVSWRTMEVIESLRLAINNQNIVSILFPVNSPGGMVFMTDIAAKEIKQSPKPTVAVVMNMATSSAQWMISAMNYRFATSPMDLVGSIGVMTTITDIQLLMKEKLGIDIQQIYASKSTRKNELFRAFKEGKTDPILKDLDHVNEIFHEAIRENLGIAADSEVFAGATYNALQGINLGLINEISSMDHAIDYAHKLGLSNKIKQYKFN